MDRRRFFTNKSLTESFLSESQKAKLLEETFDELNHLYEADENKPTEDSAKPAEDAVEKTTADQVTTDKTDAQKVEDQKAITSAEAVLDKLENADYVEFVNILNSDGKSKAFIEYLRNHYKLGDDTIETIKKSGMSKVTIACSKLHPTQKNISIDKSLGVIKKGGWSIDIIKNPANAFTTPTVVYGDKIIDGHHRWSKAYALNGPDCVISALSFPEIPGVDWEDMLKAVQLAIISTHPDAKLVNDVPDDNMLAEGAENAVRTYVINNICDEVLTAMKMKGRGKTKEEVADFAANNAKQMRSTSTPVDGAQPRSHMPQIPDNSHAFKKLKTAVIDLTD